MCAANFTLYTLQYCKLYYIHIQPLVFFQALSTFLNLYICHSSGCYLQHCLFSMFCLFCLLIYCLFSILLFYLLPAILLLYFCTFCCHPFGLFSLHLFSLFVALLLYLNASVLLVASCVLFSVLYFNL